MRILILVRHGQSTGNVEFIVSDARNKYPLTPAGKEQAQRAGRELEKLKKIDRLLTSPLLRAQQTAEEIAKFIKIKPIVNEDLIERRMGTLNDLKFSSHAEMRNTMINNMRSNTAGIEPWDEMKARCGNFISSLQDGLTVAVSHLDTIRAMVSFIEDLDWVEGYEIDGTNCSFTIIDAEDRKVLTVGRENLSDDIIRICSGK